MKQYVILHKDGTFSFSSDVAVGDGFIACFDCQDSVKPLPENYFELTAEERNAIHSDSKEKTSKLEALLNKHGICLECGQMYSHDITEPYASCGCGCSEWYDFTPYQKQEARVHKLTNENAALINVLSVHIQGELIRQVRDDSPTVDTVKKEADQLISNIASKSFDTLEQAKTVSAKLALQNLLDATCPVSGPMIKDENARKSIQDQIDRL